MAANMRKDLEDKIADAIRDEWSAYSKYSFIALRAEELGSSLVFNIFKKAAKQELIHARVLSTILGQGIITIDTKTEIKINETLLPHIMDSIENEKTDAQEYAEMAKLAAKEGNQEVAAILKGLSSAENHHRKIFTALTKIMQQTPDAKKLAKNGYSCLVCGHIMKPYRNEQKCLVCDASFGDFKPLDFYAFVEAQE